jgi:hypothetical protein
MDPDFRRDIFRYYENFDSRFILQELTYNTKISALNADAVFGGFISDEKLKMAARCPGLRQGRPTERGAGRRAFRPAR